ncbi:MAG: hypothetical protein PHW90_02285 [Bacilli bacterium]|nr:hypothetical protein [Bacilli bacterium]
MKPIFKSNKKNKYKSIKNKSLALVLTGAVFITGIGVVKMINKSRFNLDDYDEVITSSFQDTDSYEKNGIKEVSIDEKNNYNIRLDDGKVLYSSMHNAIMVDHDYEHSAKMKMPKELNRYSHAIFNYFSELKNIPIRSVMIQKINNQNMYICDLDDIRTLQSVENTVLCRKLMVDDVTSYGTPATMSTAYIIVDGKRINCNDFIGYKDIEINGVAFRTICDRLINGQYIEYVTTKEQVILVRLNPYPKSRIEGVELNYGLARGNYNTEYRTLPNLYKDIKRIVLTPDNMYHIVSVGNFEILVSPKYYHLEYLNEKPTFDFEGQSFQLGKYNEIYYNRQQYLMPINTSDIQITELNGVPFYVVGSSTNCDSGTSNCNDTNHGGMYALNTLGIKRTISREEIDSTYIMVADTVDFIANLNGNRISSHGLKTRFYAYKKVNIMEEDYYSLILETISDLNDTPTYAETLILCKNVILKGDVKQTEPSLVLKHR